MGYGHIILHYNMLRADSQQKASKCIVFMLED